MANKKNKQFRETRNLNFWAFARDLGRDSINKGQGIPYFLGLISLVIVLKMPGKDVAALANRILDLIIDLSVLGWIIGVFSSLGWFIHSRWQRRTMHEEMARVAGERNSLQQIELGDDMQSSKTRK